MLAKTYEPEKHNIINWYMSEKLDGCRALWDGGLTRGIPKDKVPWANTAKDHTRVERQISTGLWSRYGNVIHAPDSLLNELPNLILDGELFSRILTRQQLFSAVKNYCPNEKDWETIKFHVFDSPSLQELLKPGTINNPNFQRIIDCSVSSFLNIVHPFTLKWHNSDGMFCFTIAKLETWLASNPFATVVPQQIIRSLEQVEERLASVLQAGGEGLMFRAPGSSWVAKRSTLLLKYKPYQDAEGKIVGFVAGEGKYVGMLGSLQVEYKNKIFNLSGFTDEERTLIGQDLAPKTVTSGPISKYFRVGDIITFKYRMLSDDGIPMEARYHRRFDDY